MYNLFLVHFVEKLPLWHLLYIIVLSILVAFILSISPSIHLKDLLSSQWNELSFVRLASAPTPIIWFWVNCIKRIFCLKLFKEHLTPVSASKLKWSILIVPRWYWAGTFSSFSKGWGTIFFVFGHVLATLWRSKNNLTSRSHFPGWFHKGSKH